jgi:hypothetical protein
MLIITLVFEKNANFFAENCQKLQKIVIITSTPDRCNFFNFFVTLKMLSLAWSADVILTRVLFLAFRHRHLDMYKSFGQI